MNPRILRITGKLGLLGRYVLVNFQLFSLRSFCRKNRKLLKFDPKYIEFGGELGSEILGEGL